MSDKQKLWLEWVQYTSGYTVNTTQMNRLKIQNNWHYQLNNKVKQ